MKHEELNIRLKLAQRILREGKYPSMKVWLAMKGLYGAFVHKTDVDKEAIASLCGFKSTGSVDKHIKKLLS